MSQNNLMVAFKDQLKQADGEFVAALPAHIPHARFSRVLLTAVQNNPRLLNLERRSFFNAAMRSAQDGLLPDGREGAIVEFKGKAQWMPMIAGLRKKARNSGEIATWDAHVVHKNDFFDYQLGDSPYIHHKPTLEDRGDIIAAYSVATLKSGEITREIMSITEIHGIRNRGSAWKAYKAKKIKATPWATDEAEMCRKTVARRHSKVLPMSTDLDDLMRRDDDLYDMKTVSDQNAPASNSLSDKLMESAPDAKRPERGPDIEATAEEVHDAETGEVVEEKYTPPKRSDKKPAQSEKAQEKTTAEPEETKEKPADKVEPSTEEAIEAAYAKGQTAYSEKRRSDSGPKSPADISEAWVRGWADADADNDQGDD